jgi:hypothetical protein
MAAGHCGRRHAFLSRHTSMCDAKVLDLAFPMPANDGDGIGMSAAPDTASDCPDFMKSKAAN